MSRIKAVLLGLLLLSSAALAQQPAKTVSNYIAVMDLNCGEGVKKTLAGPLTNVIIEELVKIGKFTVIDRANRDKILAEVGFQQSGCVSESCAVEMGQMLGVGKLVVGSIALVGGTYLINLQLINVQTGAVENAASETCKCELDGLIETVRNASRKLMGMSASSPGRTGPVTMPGGAQRIGDGPFCMVPPEGWMPKEPSGNMIAGYKIGTESFDVQISVMRIAVGNMEVQAAHDMFVNAMKGEFRGAKVIENKIIERNGLVMGVAEFTGKKKGATFHFLLTTVMDGTNVYWFSGSTPGKEEYFPAIQKAFESIAKC